jgi:N utilization substance protein B
LAGTTLRAALSGARLAKSAAAQDRKARTTFVNAKPASTKPVNPAAPSTRSPYGATPADPAALSARWPYGNAPAHPAVRGTLSDGGTPPVDPAIPGARRAEGMTLAAALAAGASAESGTAANANAASAADADSVDAGDAGSADAESADANLVSSDPTDAGSASADPVAAEKTSPRAQARSKKPSSGATKPPGSKATHTFAATRSVARKLALQALYRWQLNEGPWQDLVLEFGEAEDMPNADREYFRELVEGVWGSRQALDSRLAELTDRPPEQLDPVEHAVLLIGLYELSSRPEVPYRVSINEAVGLTKRFGATDGHKFVNAVLDRAARALRPHED